MRLIDILDGYLMASDEEHRRRSHWASDANACVRQLVYKWRAVEMSDPPTPGDVLKWRMGEAAEELMYGALDWAKGRGLIVDWERQVRREVDLPGLRHPVVCKLDAVVYPAAGEAEGVEVKSMFGRGIVEIQRGGRPKPDHMVQVLLYMHFGGRPVHNLVYIGRDFGYRTEFQVTYDGRAVAVNGTPYAMPEVGHYVERFRRIEHHLDNPEEVPPRDFLAAIKDGEVRSEFTDQKVRYRSDWQCMYCAWLHRCWEAEAARHAVGNNGRMFAARGRQEETTDEIGG